MFKKVFLFFVIISTLGCSTTKWEWSPEEKFPHTHEEKETGAVKTTVLKVSW